MPASESAKAKRGVAATATADRRSGDIVVGFIVASVMLPDYMSILAQWLLQMEVCAK